MYDVFKAIIFFCLLFLCAIVALVFNGCQSTKVVYDNGTGTEDYRNQQSEIRNGETELAITGAELESTSDRIGESIRDIRNTSEELERTIKQSEVDEQSVGEIIQHVRNREIPTDRISQLGIEIIE